MDLREKFENALYSVRFVGEELSVRGVSIYDLSHTLIAFQRIVHKAHLAQENRLTKGAFPDKDARQRLALQIGERRRQSDAFALLPILADLHVQQYMEKLADYVFSGIVGYYTGDVLMRLKGETDLNKQIFISSIYTEVTNIANRVDASGGVEAINIGAPLKGHSTVATFDAETKNYLSTLKDEFFLGDFQEIKGRVYKLYPASKIVAIKRNGGTSVSIFLNDADFDRIRYHQESRPLFNFKGRPRYQFGVQTKIITAFEADSIDYMPNEFE